MNIHTGSPPGEGEGLDGFSECNPPDTSQPGWLHRLIPALLAALRLFLIGVLFLVLFLISLCVTDFFFGLVTAITVFCRDWWTELGISVLTLETVLAIIITAITTYFLNKNGGISYGKSIKIFNP
jgi:hypothetical protein